MRDAWAGNIFPKIGRNPFFEVLGFADVKDGGIGIQHAIDAGEFSQCSQEGLGIETHRAGLGEAGLDPGKHRLKAFTGKPAGTPVVATAMVAVDKSSPVRQGVADVVAEGEFLELEVVSPKQCLVGDGTKGDDDFQSGHRSQFNFQVAVALTNFSRCRLIGRWEATHGIGDPAVA